MRPKLLVASAALALAPVVLGAACSPEVDCAKARLELVPAAPVGACPEDPQASIVARFQVGASAQPDFLEVPFPSDVYLAGERFVEPIPGLDRVIKRSSEFIAHEIAARDGWSRIAPAMFLVDDHTAPRTEDGEVAAAVIDRASLPADEAACSAEGSSVFLVDLEATGPAARVPCRALINDDRALSSTRPLLAVGPARGYVLPEGHRYAAVLTSRVRDDKGRALQASDDFAVAARGEGPLGVTYGAAMAKVEGVLGPALATDGAKIVALAPYRTQRSTDALFGARDWLEKQKLTLSWEKDKVLPMANARFCVKVNDALPAGCTASLDDWLGVVDAKHKLPDGSDDPDSTLPVRAHDQIAAVGTAVFDAPNYLRQRGGYSVLDHATFATDGEGRIVPAPEKPKQKIWVTIAVPKAPRPAAGYPTVIIQHGLSSSRAYLLSMANTFAKQGWIAVAIDSITFGARAPDKRYQVDKNTDYEKTPGATYEGPDGLADAALGDRNGPFDLFGGLRNLGALRDQLRQAALDTAALVRLLRSNPDLSPLATSGDAPTIDPDRIAYVGDSLGAIEGTMAAAIEPNVRAWMLNVAGGGIFSEIAPHGPAINAQLSGAGAVNFGFRGDRFGEAHPLAILAQTLVEPGDPLAYVDALVTKPRAIAGKASKPRNVLHTEVLFDELVPNEASEALARAGGWLLAKPNVGLNAGMQSVAPAAIYPGGGTVLGEVGPKDGAISGTPRSGVTAVLVQLSPAQHGENMVASKAKRSYPIPYHGPDGVLVAERSLSLEVPCPYRDVQRMIVDFFGAAFEGKVPMVRGAPTPKRDFDADGKPDSTDPNPSER